MKLRKIIASDVSNRNGIGIEFYHGEKIFIEIFRDDLRKTRIINTFGNDIPLEVMEECIITFKKEIPLDFQ
jgi:hypothetical protein